MNYPYYIANYYEELFTPPPGMKQVYKSFNKKYKELRSDDFQDLVRQLEYKGQNWRYDDVTFYEVREGGPRRRLNNNDVMNLL